MGIDIVLKDVDRRVWDEELADFVPERLYDVHTHIFDGRPDWPMVLNGSPIEMPNVSMTNWAMLEEGDALLFPGREVHRISFGNPLQSCPLDEANAFVASEVSADAESVALMMVRPDLSAEDMAEQVEKHGFRGVKPYRVHAVTGDAVECRITDYLPESQIEVADRFGLMVMLHMAKSRAIADPENLSDLEDLTVRFPRVQWVLAHCARSYYDGPLLQAADRLRNIGNLWYEISSVCDSDAMDVLLSVGGPDRVMYGSDDLMVGVTRGKYITFGYAWTELNEGNNSFNIAHCPPDMTFVRYESLRAFRRACRRHDYGKAEIEKLFYANARELIKATKG